MCVIVATIYSRDGTKDESMPVTDVSEFNDRIGKIAKAQVEWAYFIKSIETREHEVMEVELRQKLNGRFYTMTGHYIYDYDPAIVAVMRGNK